MCSALADQLESIGLERLRGQQVQVDRKWFVRHGELRMLHRELVERWAQLHGQLRFRFGSRHGTIELPAVDGSVQMVIPPLYSDAAPDLTSCVVCWEEPYTHAFWPCGHCCVCRKCASTWRKGRLDHRVCLVCQKAAIECSQVYNA